jgi:hypothetical protein
MAEPKLRAQYHSRMLPQGMCVWDIRRLVELSRSLAIERVPLSAIRELDEPYWDGDNDQRLTCRDVAAHARLISECDLSFPVILSSDGRAMDGMHRVCKALSLGHDTIDAVRFLRDPEPDHIGIPLDDLPYDD